MKIKKILTNRLLLSTICLVIAGLISFILIPSFYKNKEATTKILVLKEDVEAGTQITDEILEIAEIGSYGLPKNLILDKKEILGKYTKLPILKNDYLVPDKFKDFIFDERLDNIIKENKRLITLTLPTVSCGLSSHLQKNDIVSVANFIGEKERVTPDGMSYEPSKVVLHDELKEILVYDIENTKTESTVDIRENKDEKDSLYDPVPKTVTLIVTEDQALKLVEAENIGKIHLIFVKRTVS